MQMLLYQLTSDGNMNFEHISEKIPFFENNVLQESFFEERASPRIFKTHLMHMAIPKGPCRYIYVTRDGRDVAVSYYHFYCSHLGCKEPFHRFFERFLSGRVQYGSWFSHVAKWRKRQGKDQILFVHYEDLLRDLLGTSRKIALFLGLLFDDSVARRISERCTFGYMKDHESQFDFTTEVKLLGKAKKDAFIRSGRAGGWASTLNSAQTAAFNAKFEEYCLRSLEPIKESP